MVQGAEAAGAGRVAALAQVLVWAACLMCRSEAHAVQGVVAAAAGRVTALAQVVL